MAKNVLSLGAGVQSSTLVYLSHAGLIPQYDKIYFADTGDEPQAVYEHLDYLHTLADIEVATIDSGASISDHLYSEELKIFAVPFYIVHKGAVSVLKRQCTNEFKIVPIDKAIRRWLQTENLATPNKLGHIRVKRNARVNVHLGFSLDESRRVSSSRVQWKIHKYPLIELGMTRHDCVIFAAKYGYKLPPKSSCIFCPYHTDDYWKTLTPDELERACVFDDYIRSPEFREKTKSLKGELYLHSSCRPLRDVIADGFKTGHQLPVQLSFASELLEITCKSDGGFSCFS